MRLFTFFITFWVRRIVIIYGNTEGKKEDIIKKLIKTVKYQKTLKHSPPALAPGRKRGTLLLDGQQAHLGGN